MIGTRSQNRIRPDGRLICLRFHDYLLFFDLWIKVPMSVQVFLLKLYWLDLHRLHFLQVRLVIETIAQHIAERA